MSSPNPYQSQSAGKPRTKIKRDYVKTGVIGTVVVLSTIVAFRIVTKPRETQEQRQQREAAAAAAQAPTGASSAFAQKLTEQQAQAKAQQLASGERTTSSATSNGGPLPSGAQFPQSNAPLPGAAPGLSDADRLALERGASNLQDTATTTKVWEANSNGGDASSGPQGAVGAMEKSLQQQLNQLQGMAAAGPEAGRDRMTRVGYDGGQGGGNSALSAAYAAAMGKGSAGSPGSDVAKQQERWQNGQGSREDDGPLRPIPATTRYLLGEGENITAVIQQNQSTDAPGTIRATVDRDIMDSIRGTCVVIPRGTTMKGVTGHDVAVGQERMLVAMTLMRFPTGAKLLMGSMGVGDPDGTAGLTADVNNHFAKIFGSTFLIAGVAAWIGNRQNNQSSGATVNINGGSSSSALSQAAGQTLTQTTQTILQRNMNIQPTLSLTPGQRMVVSVARDMDLPPSLTGGRCY
ncbi:TrbI/VirB10 family protein [Burkholderia cenocepacia]|uniref:TrbI/VirB10 family protein n=1 Tax=Burkholderia cenocepacia TaxID=95486 RepID=UPI00223020A1|nr:TrbI/VirB10 family protein [Burkholderia cenocepacia]MCW3677837.1 TrbI/VirB10 family protein [Burkholderia cenocepacia]